MSRLSSAGLTVFDQFLSSVTNFVPAIVAARVLEPMEFGVFALLQAVYVTGIGAVRAAAVESAVVTSRSITDGRGVPSNVVLWFCAALAVPLLVVSPWLPPAILVVALALGVMFLQDTQRVEGLSTGRVNHALLSDGAWLLLTVAAIAFGTARGLLDEPSEIFAAWGAAALPGTLLVYALQRFRPRLGSAVAFVRSEAATIGAHTYDWLLRQGAMQTSLYAIALVAGLTVMGDIRVAQLILGPMNIVFAGVGLAAMPIAARAARTSMDSFRRLVQALAAFQGLAPLVFGAVVLATPQTILAIPFGEQTAGMKPYFLPQVVLLAVSGFAATAQTSMKILHMRRELVRTRTFTAFLALACTVAPGLAAHSALAALWGMAVGSAIAASIWVYVLTSHDAWTASAPLQPDPALSQGEA